MISRMAKRAMYSARTPPFGYFHFATLSKAAIKAIYARRFVQMIQFLEEPLSVHSLVGQLKKKQEESENKSLKDRLLSYDVKNDLQKLQMFQSPNEKDLFAAKEQMHAYFKGGIPLNYKTFTQDRFTNVTNFNSLFEFLPTNLVTGQVFTILNQKEDRILIYGRKGISKSSAIALKSLLEGEICAFRIQQTQKKSSLTSEDLKAFKELDKIIGNRDVKYFYWSIQPIRNQDFGGNKIFTYSKNIIESLYAQCGDLSPQFKKEANDLTQKMKQKQKLLIDSSNNKNIEEAIQFCNNSVGYFVEMIKQKLNNDYKIKTVVIADQINTIFSLTRQINTIARASQSKFQQEQKNWEIKLNIVNFLSKLLGSVMQLSTIQVIFNSSINIQDEYLKSTFSKIDSKQVFVDIGKRDNIKRSLVRFSESKIKQFWTNEMKQFFYFEIKRQIGIVDQANMIKLANFIFSLRPNKPFTPLLLRELVKDNKQLFGKQTSPNKQIQFKEDQIKFVENDRKHHLDFLQKIPEEAFKSNLRFIMSVLMNNSFQLNNSTISIAAKIMNKSNNIGQLEKMLNREYFQIVTDEKGDYMVETSFNFDDILYFYNAVRTLSQDKPLSDTDIRQFVDKLSEFVNLRGPALGLILQHIMIMALTSKTSSLLKIQNTHAFLEALFGIANYAPVPNLTKVNKLLQVTGQIQSIPIQSCRLFVPTLDEIYKKSYSQLINKQDMAENISPNSKGIDFMIIKKQRKEQKNKYVFNMFQLTVQKANLNNKIRKALAFISDLEDFEKNQVKVSKNVTGDYQINLYLIHNSKDKKQQKLVQQNQFAKLIQYVKDFKQKNKLKRLQQKGKLNVYQVSVQSLYISPLDTTQRRLYKIFLQYLSINKINDSILKEKNAEANSKKRKFSIKIKQNKK